MLAPSVPAPDLVIYLHAKPEVLRKRVSKKGDPAETQISPDYLEAVANAYGALLLPLFRRRTCSWWTPRKSTSSSAIEDLQELLRRLRQPVKGTQYFLPLGQS